MTYQQALDYIHGFDRFGIQPGLERVTELLRRLQDPQEAIPAVHVAGTNGKGSTCTMLSYGLAGAGYKVGLYTSPYVLDFRERMQIVTKDGIMMISEEDLCRLVETVAPVSEAVSREVGNVTEFEFITACAFLWFAAMGVDLSVIEVGLGGRFDATNVLTSPLCSVIATVGLDHTDILGQTLEEIAGEKAGIIKQGCPVVSTYLQETAVLDRLFAVCQEKETVLRMPEERHLTVKSRDPLGSDVSYFGRDFRVPFPGDHMVANALAALTAAFVLRDVHGYSLHNLSFLEGLQKAFIPARQELLRPSPALLLDGSHNPDGLKQLAATVERFWTEGGKPAKGSLLIIGMLKDKDVIGSASAVVRLFERVVTVTPLSPRAMAAQDLAVLLSQRFPDKEVTARSVEEAAREAADNGGTAVVAGSLYLAADIRPRLLRRLGGEK